MSEEEPRNVPGVRFPGPADPPLLSRSTDGVDQVSAGIHSATCQYCGESLTPHERATGKVCGGPECRRQQAAEFARHRLQHDRQLRERAGDLAKSALGSTGESGEQKPGDRVIGFVPLNPRSLRGIKKNRVRRFEEHLQRSITRAMAERYGNRPDPSAETEDLGYEEKDGNLSLSQGQVAVLHNTCRLCGGDCCHRGGTHAFVSSATIGRFMSKHPDLRPIEVFEAYTSRIGAVSYEESCVFHAESGCRLPRDMRSNVCNGYSCQGLDRIETSLAAKGVETAVVSSFSDYYSAGSQERSDPVTSSVRVARLEGARYLPVVLDHLDLGSSLAFGLPAETAEEENAREGSSDAQGVSPNEIQ